MMKQKENFLKVVEMLVLVAFLVAYKLSDLQIATAVLVIASTLFVLLVKFLGEKLTKLQVITWLVVVILGSATVILKDESIIKWKPTVINAFISFAFLITHFIGKKTLLERLIDEKVPAPARKLRKVNFAGSMFFLFLGVANILVAQNFSTNIWMNFKIFGITALNLCFLSCCLYYLKDYLTDFFPPESNKKK